METRGSDLARSVVEADYSKVATATQPTLVMTYPILQLPQILAGT
jgi:hypothetical protein